MRWEPKERTITAQDFITRHAPAWHTAWLALSGRAGDEALLQALVARHSEPHRHYHTLAHLHACLRHLPDLCRLATHPDEVALALWFHDAIYDIGATNNERRSADWATRALLSASVESAVARRVSALIMVTRHDEAPRTLDEQVMLDVDLAILGEHAEVFDSYEHQVRAEYHTVPEALFRANRRRILQAFLARERIYHTDRFHARFETPARHNLARSIAALQD